MSPRVQTRLLCSMIVQHRGQGGIDKGIVEQTFFEDQVATDKFPAGSSGNSSVRQQGSPRWVGFLGALVSLLCPRVSFFSRLSSFCVANVDSAAAVVVVRCCCYCYCCDCCCHNHALEIDGFLRSQHVSTQYAQSEGEPTPPNIGKIKCAIILFEMVFGDCSSLLSGSGLD